MMGKIKTRFEVHAHDDSSNIRLIDCINPVEKLIDRAIDNGLSGIAITNHECLCSHPKANQYALKIQKDNPDFKVALGNEIYLCPNRENKQKYFHFILIAKNAEGHRALRELSSCAWINSYHDRGMERCVTTYDELREMLERFPNSLIGTTACLGGQLSSKTMEMIEAETCSDIHAASAAKLEIITFIKFCIEIFGDDFYIEVAPGLSKEQIAVNKRLSAIAASFQTKMVVGTDAHFLSKEDRLIHKAYLNSKDGEREIDSFYAYSYLQTEEEIQEHLQKSELDYASLVENSYEIYEKIENYSLFHTQTIPRVAVSNYPKNNFTVSQELYPTLSLLCESDYDQERYWVNECILSLRNKIKVDKSISEEDYNIYLERLEIEAKVIKRIGEELNDCLYAYFNTFQHYIDLFWECGSIVGPGRGSSVGFLSNYMLGITQLDPVVWDLPYWRFLNEARFELPDIDIDLAPSKRPLILDNIKKERSQMFNENIKSEFKENLGVTLVATFGTEKTRSAVLSACRGYRSEEYPNGIDSDVGQFLTSLIPEERGFLWSLSDVVNGNPEKDRKPVRTFNQEISKYDGLIDIALGLEGLINKRSSHASGVIMYEGDPFEYCCFMKTPSGEIITQYDLHTAEWCGNTKYDFLVTEVTDKLTEALSLLQRDKIIAQASLRDTYNQYLHPSILDVTDDKIWNSMGAGDVLDCFQFSDGVGLTAAKKLRPTSPVDMSNANAVMRLMASEKGGEVPLDKFSRFKSNFPAEWYSEMKQYGVTASEKLLIEEIYSPAYGCPCMQEDLMQIVMKTAHFDLSEANFARKVVAKKNMSKIPELREKFFNGVGRDAFANYLWDTCVKPQLGYGFSSLHSLAYSFVGIQTLVLATKFNPIYWNTACLIVNSGSLEDGRDKAVDYGKIAKAIGDIRTRGIKVSLVDINKSDYSFIPNSDNNEILFGMNALSSVNSEIIEEIKTGRPYVSMTDFINRTKVKKLAMISLIKSGAFDGLVSNWAEELGVQPRMLAMTYFLSLNCDAKKKLTLQNFNGLIEKDVFGEDLQFEKKVYAFNKFLKANCKVGKYYVFNEVAERFYEMFFAGELLEVINGLTCILQTSWDKEYKRVMNTARDYIKNNHDNLLKIFNQKLFLETWNKYATGSISAWEMDSMCFYYSDHELKDMDTVKYGIVNFTDLNEESEVAYYFKRNGKSLPIYALSHIAGTVIAKNDSKSTVSILTIDGVVNVKFTKDYYANYSRQLSEKQSNGVKKVIEKGWFTRGVKIMCTGFRRGDTFVAKTYKNTPTHQLYKIVEVENGELALIHERMGGEE